MFICTNAGVTIREPCLSSQVIVPGIGSTYNLSVVMSTVGSIFYFRIPLTLNQQTVYFMPK